LARIDVLPHGVPADASPMAAQIGGLLQQGMRPIQIADRLHIARSTVSL
jgi:DNA-binding CsgD family transcriptional regulator